MRDTKLRLLRAFVGRTVPLKTVTHSTGLNEQIATQFVDRYMRELLDEGLIHSPADDGRFRATAKGEQAAAPAAIVPSRVYCNATQPSGSLVYALPYRGQV